VAARSSPVTLSPAVLDYLRSRFLAMPFQLPDGVERNMMREAGRVSAFKNFFMSLSAESFSFLVFETVQSAGTNKLKSRI
jgi:hypothetical protein